MVECEGIVADIFKILLLDIREVVVVRPCREGRRENFVLPLIFIGVTAAGIKSIKSLEYLKRGTNAAGNSQLGKEEDSV